MKMTAFFLLVGLLSVSANTAAQVSLKEKSASLEKVLKAIKKQSPEYGLSYDELLIRTKAKPVDVHFNNVSVEKALEIVFMGQDQLTYSLTNKIISVKEKKSHVLVEDFGSRQSSTPLIVRGRITNEYGQPVAGVNIAIKGGKVIGVTNDDGEFLLNDVADNAILVFSAVTIETIEVKLNGRTELTLRSKTKVSQLDEVQMIAYGTTTKRINTGSVSTVKKEDISKQPVSNPLSALMGRVSGLQITPVMGVPGAAFTVRLRGQNSIASGNDPMYIIDGVQFPSTSLTSSFGGGAGASTSPLNNLNTQDIESIEVLKDADATAIYGSRAANGVILITTKKGAAGRTKFDVNFYTGAADVKQRLKLLNTPQYLEMRREAFRNDGITPTIANAKDLLLWDTTRYTDWQDVIFGKTATINDIQASVTGGNANTQFLLGGGYHKETTVFRGDFGEDKYSFRFNGSHTSADKKLTVSLGANYIQVKNVLPRLNPFSYIFLPPVAPAIYDTDGNLNWENSSWDNPMADLRRENIASVVNYLANATLSYRIMPSLTFKATLGYNNIMTDDVIKLPARSYNPALNVTTMALFSKRNVRTLVTEPQLQYMRSFGKNQLNVIVGGTIQKNDQKELQLVGRGYSTDDLLGSIRSASTVTVNNDNETQYKYSGLFARLTYDLDKTYILNVTARRDGSSRFGPNNKYANLGSIGGAWIFGNSRFIKNRMGFLSFGKLRSSFGVTGNDQIGDYKYLNTYSPYTYQYQTIRPFYPTQLYNPSYQWERVNKFSIAMDLGLFNNALLVSTEFYSNTTGNQLVNYALPVITGFSGITQNLPARVRNSGFEFNLDYNLIKRNGISWQFSLNMSLPRNTLLSYPNIEGSSYANSYVIGKSLFISKKFMSSGVNPQTGLYTFTDFNNNGTISNADDRNLVFFTGQQFFGGFQNSLKYKGWQLDIDFQFAKCKYGSTSFPLVTPGTANNQPEYVLGRWQSPGDITSVQKFTTLSTQYSNFTNSDAGLDNASFLRLRTIYLSYSLSPKILKKAHIENARFFIQGQNLFTITSYKGLDPETGSNTIPQLRVITGGFHFTL